MEFTVLGVAAGNGVILHPFHISKHFTVLGNIEPRSLFKTDGDHAWNRNFKGIPLVKTLELAKPYGWKPDIIVSHPDCGSGSVLSYSRAKHLSSISSNDSFITFRLSINHYKPKFFLFENLEAVFKNYPKPKFKKNFKNYYLIFRVISMAKLGNSQVNRKRLLVIGVRKDIYKKPDKRVFRPFAVSYGPLLCRRLFKDFDYTPSPERGIYNEPLNQVISMYGGFKISLAEAKKIWKTKLRYESRWEVNDRKYTKAPGVYRNLNNRYPNTARKSNRQFNHHGLDMSARELAVIQGVPEEFSLSLRPSKIKYDSNKAKVTVTKTPPYEVGIWFRQAIKAWVKGKEKRTKKEKEKNNNNIPL